MELVDPNEKSKVVVDEAGAIYNIDKEGRMWQLSPRDYAGNIKDNKLTITELGEFHLCY